MVQVWVRRLLLGWKKWRKDKGYWLLVIFGLLRVFMGGLCGIIRLFFNAKSAKVSAKVGKDKSGVIGV